MASNKDLDCSEFVNALEQLEPKLKARRNAIVDNYGNKAKNQAAQATPIMKRNWDKRKKGELKQSWKAQRVKEYRNGNVAVARVLSDSPIAHLINDGHEVYTAARKGAGNIRGKKIAKRSAQQQEASKVKHHGFREGEKMLEKAFESLQPELTADAEAMLDAVIKEVGLE